MIVASYQRWMPLFRISVIAAAGLLVIAPATLAATKARPTRKAADPVADTSAYRGAIVIDAANGNVLFERNADEVSPPASMTKLMTFAVLSDKLAKGEITLETPIRIDASDARMGGTEVFLDPRETFSVEELIYAMMIQSANDAAHALGRASGGSVEAFVEQMNAKARELGMTHTTFRSPHGLPPDSKRIADGDLTTPRDFALLCRYVLLHTDVLKYTSVKTRDFGPERPKGPQHMENHNKLLTKVAGVDGLKTGYTQGAGYCISATAERNGRRIIAVVMGSFGPGGTIDKGVTRDRVTIALLEQGFQKVPPGSSNFDAERAKYVKPAVISLDAPPPAGSPSATAKPSTPATAPAASDQGPTIKLSLPKK
jgi:D-alanyl-D-alanine carboxypeptidase